MASARHGKLAPIHQPSSAKLLESDIDQVQVGTTLLSLRMGKPMMVHDLTSMARAHTLGSLGKSRSLPLTSSIYEMTLDESFYAAVFPIADIEHQLPEVQRLFTSLFEGYGWCSMPRALLRLIFAL